MQLRQLWLHGSVIAVYPSICRDGWHICSMCIAVRVLLVVSTLPCCQACEYHTHVVLHSSWWCDLLEALSCHVGALTDERLHAFARRHVVKLFLKVQ